MIFANIFYNSSFASLRPIHVCSTCGVFIITSDFPSYLHSSLKRKGDEIDKGSFVADVWPLSDAEWLLQNNPSALHEEKSISGEETKRYEEFSSFSLTYRGCGLTAEINNHLCFS